MEGCSEKFTKFTYCSNGEILLVSMCTKKIWKKKLFYLQCILLSRQQKLSLRNQLYMSHISNEVVNVWVSSLKITVGHRTMSDQIRKLSDQTKNIPDILSERKIWSKIKCPIRVCFFPTINWRYLTKLLILSGKYLSNKSL